jgi:hypothetical protein
VQLTPLSTHWAPRKKNKKRVQSFLDTVYLSYKEIYCILRHAAILYSTKCHLFQNFIFLCLNNTFFTNNVPKFKYQLGRLKVRSEISCENSSSTLHCWSQCTVSSLIPHVMQRLGTPYSHACIYGYYKFNTPLSCEVVENQSTFEGLNFLFLCSV